MQLNKYRTSLVLKTYQQPGSIRLPSISPLVNYASRQDAPESLSLFVLHSNPSSLLTCQSPEVAVCTSFKLRVHIISIISRTVRVNTLPFASCSAVELAAPNDPHQRLTLARAEFPPFPGWYPPTWEITAEVSLLGSSARWFYLKLSMTGNTGFADLIDSSCN